MPVSNTLRTAVNSQETPEVFIILMTIDHADIAEPIRVSSDTVDTISRGNTFISFHFELDLPTSTEREVPRAKINISNVDRQIVKGLRDISPGSDPATVLVEVVLASDPDTLEITLPGFELTSAKYKRLNVEGDITQETFYQEPYPKDSFTPGLFPGIFK